ncbi:MAG: DsbC family protein [Gammaproteobacteria bacterium]
MRKTRSLVYFAALLLAGHAHAEGAIRQRLTEVLMKVSPGMKVISVRPAALDGLYEVQADGEIFYMSEDGKFLVKGDLLDIDSLRNLTDERRGQVNIEALRGVAPTSMIEFAPKDTRHVLYVYTDVDCGYCRKFHQQVGQLNDAGIAIRYLAFPRAGIGSESYAKAVSVWCAKDRRTALTDAKAGKPVKPANCDNPVVAQYELGQRMGVQGTPALYTETGQAIGGYIPADRLVKMLAKPQ